VPTHAAPTSCRYLTAGAATACLRQLATLRSQGAFVFRGGEGGGAWGASGVSLHKEVAPDGFCTGPVVVQLLHLCVCALAAAVQVHPVSRAVRRTRWWRFESGVWAWATCPGPHTWSSMPSPPACCNSTCCMLFCVSGAGVSPVRLSGSSAGCLQLEHCDICVKSMPGLPCLVSGAFVQVPHFSGG
jgi:hypothetical protein